MQVGDYVRTKKRGFQPPQIAKIRGMEKDSGYHNQYFVELDHNLIPDYEFCIYKEDIEKSSPNIIDLIEVGDYVNGERVVGVIKKYKYLEISDEAVIISEKYIKSIVTKEQFKIMEYKLGDDK
jgi:hypothetical protein